MVTKAQISNQAADALIAKLECPDRVKDVAFSADGKLLAAGYGWNDQGGARIWNVADRSAVATLKREAFSRVFNQEEQFINSLLRAGLTRHVDEKKLGAVGRLTTTEIFH